MQTFELENILAFESVETLHWHPELDSTNEEAKRFLAVNQTTKSLPLLVLCDLQTAGRGQPGRSWFSDHQSLTFTWCADADLVSADVATILPLLAGAAICNGLAKLGINSPRLKWPNDVLLDHRKVCGILVEKIHFAKQNFHLIGVGINVNQNSIPKQGTRFEPASLKQISGRDYSLTKVLQHSLESLAAYWNGLTLDQSSVGHVLDQHKHWFAFHGKQIEFEPPNEQPIRGVFRGVDESGFLLLEDETTVHTFSSGRIVRACE